MKLRSFESHGTGTPLGDVTEVRAITLATCEDDCTSCPNCVIGGIKANVGHLEPAAGMAGLGRMAATLKAACDALNAQLKVLSPMLVDAATTSDISLPVEQLARRSQR